MNESDRRSGSDRRQGECRKSQEAIEHPERRAEDRRQKGRRESDEGEEEVLEVQPDALERPKGLAGILERLSGPEDQREERKNKLWIWSSVVLGPAVHQFSRGDRSP